MLSPRNKESRLNFSLSCPSGFVRLIPENGIDQTNCLVIFTGFVRWMSSGRDKRRFDFTMCRIYDRTQDWLRCWPWKIRRDSVRSHETIILRGELIFLGWNRDPRFSNAQSIWTNLTTLLITPREPIWYHRLYEFGLFSIELESFIASSQPTFLLTSLVGFLCIRSTSNLSPFYPSRCQFVTRIH